MIVLAVVGMHGRRCYPLVYIPSELLLMQSRGLRLSRVFGLSFNSIRFSIRSRFDITTRSRLAGYLDNRRLRER